MKNAVGTATSMPFVEKSFAATTAPIFGKSAGAGNQSIKYVRICRNRDKKGPEGCSIKAVDGENLKAAFIIRVVNRRIKDKDRFISKILENIERVFIEKIEKNKKEFWNFYRN